MEIQKKEAYIFDMDGTIYSLERMHRMMFLKILMTLIVHPNCWNEIYAVYKFRKYKEKLTKCLIEQVFAKVSTDVKKSDVWVKNVVIKWMFDIPMKYIEKCVYRNVIDFINNVREDGKVVCIYSDYPVKDKLEALQLKVDYVFTSEDNDIVETKPSSKAMAAILSRIGLAPDKILYIGDRDEKDGKSAELAGIDYMDVRKFIEVVAE